MLSNVDNILGYLANDIAEARRTTVILDHPRIHVDALHTPLFSAHLHSIDVSSCRECEVTLCTKQAHRLLACHILAVHLTHQVSEIGDNSEGAKREDEEKEHHEFSIAVNT